MASCVAGQAAQTIAGSSSSLHSAPTSRFNPQSQHNSASASLGGPSTNFHKGDKGLHARLRPKFAKSLAPLEVNKGSQQHFVHVQYTFKPGPNTNSVEPVTVTVSTPLAVVARCVSPSKSLDLTNQDALKKELEGKFQLPSPDRDDVSVSVDIKRHPYADLQVGDRWQEVQGANQWEKLLKDYGKDIHIDPVLRGELIRYGEFAQATYDAFDNDPNSKTPW
jgi:hypothetical protein